LAKNDVEGPSTGSEGKEITGDGMNFEALGYGSNIPKNA
jgi:hypothetical protein